MSYYCLPEKTRNTDPIIFAFNVTIYNPIFLLNVPLYHNSPAILYLTNDIYGLLHERTWSAQGISHEVRNLPTSI